jgi:hypothetical protein
MVQTKLSIPASQPVSRERIEYPALQSLACGIREMNGKELGPGRRLRICDLLSITPHKSLGFPSLVIENEKEKPPDACHSIMTGFFE